VMLPFAFVRRVRTIAAAPFEFVSPIYFRTASILLDLWFMVGFCLAELYCGCVLLIIVFIMLRPS